MIRGDFLSFFFFFFFLRRTRTYFSWTYCFPNGISSVASAIFFFFWGGGRRAVYMWILIRDHGRLRVPRQAKFLSCKYWGVYLGHKLITATLGRALIRLWGFASSVVC